MLHLHLGPNHRSMYSLNFFYDVSDLIFSGSDYFYMKTIDMTAKQTKYNISDKGKNKFACVV